MQNFLDRIIDYFQTTSDFILYIFLLLSAVIENLFPPIPGDTITAFGAFLVGTGRLSYPLVFLSTTIGSVIGFMMLFGIGKYIGKDFFIEKDYKYFPAEKIIITEKWFLKYGYFVVLANRFLPGIRSVISVVSGLLRLSSLRVFIFALISSAIWNLIWIHTGFLLGGNWETVKDKLKVFLKGYNIIVTVIIVSAVIIYFIYRKYNRKPGG